MWDKGHLGSLTLGPFCCSKHSSSLKPPLTAAMGAVLSSRQLPKKALLWPLIVLRVWITILTLDYWSYLILQLFHMLLIFFPTKLTPVFSCSLFVRPINTCWLIDCTELLGRLRGRVLYRTPIRAPSLWGRACYGISLVSYQRHSWISFEFFHVSWSLCHYHCPSNELAC